MFRCHYLFDTIKNSIILWLVQENGASKRLKKDKKQTKNPQQNSCWFLLPVISGQPMNSTGLCEVRGKENLLLGFKELSLPLIVNASFSKSFSL